MLPFSAMYTRLLNSARATLNAPEKQFGEDTIDWLHRLAKLNYGPQEISDITEVPFANVEYWYYANGYDQQGQARELLEEDEGASA